MNQHEIQITNHPLHEYNQNIRSKIQQKLPIIVTDTHSHHNLKINLPTGTQIHFDNSINYYYNNLNNNTNITISRNTN